MNPFESVKDYYDYKNFIEKETLRLTEEADNTESLRIEYTEHSNLNLRRMSRLEKTYHVSEEVQAVLNRIPSKQIWWVITELWCGDSAQILPILEKYRAAQPDKIELRIILRDDHLEIMDQYLTNGGRSVPKLIIRDAATNEEIITWGPRPKAAQEVVDKAKADPNMTEEDMINALYAWYPKDKGVSVEKEIMALFE